MWFDAYNYVLSGYKEIDYIYPLKIIKRGIFLDTAPLFILVVGHYDKKYNTNFIKNFQSKTKKGKIIDRNYRPFDYDYLLAFLNSFGLGNYSLYITPQIFTEFIKHLWEYVDKPEHFKTILEETFKTKKYLKKIDFNCFKCLEEKDFLNKELEVGDVSITVLAKDTSNPYKTLLTDDEPFAIIADKKFDFITIFYNHIRTGTLQLGRNNIPKKLFDEPPNN